MPEGRGVGNGREECDRQVTHIPREITVKCLLAPNCNTCIDA